MTTDYHRLALLYRENDKSGEKSGLFEKKNESRLVKLSNVVKISK